jgi:hypothetical protein
MSWNAREALIQSRSIVVLEPEDALIPAILQALDKLHSRLIKFILR